jgi:nucleotide-binding universal stress UspA family protein
MNSEPSGGPRRILVPIDFSTASERAIGYACSLAQPGDEILLLHVIPGQDPDSSVVPPPARRDEIQQLARQAAEGACHDLVQRLKVPAEVALASETVAGEADREIPLQAIVNDADLIVMATHGRGAAGRLAFGSVADGVARNATVPVLLLRARPDAGKEHPAVVKRVVVPLDGSEPAAQALPVAASLAKELDASIFLISIQEINPAVLMPSPIAMGAIYDEYETYAEQELAQMLQAAAAPLQAAGITIEWGVYGGPVAPTIAGLVHEDDIVVMTSHGRSGLQRWLMGSVAEHLVRHAPAPVMVVPTTERASQIETSETVSPGRK